MMCFGGALALNEARNSRRPCTPEHEWLFFSRNSTTPVQGGEAPDTYQHGRALHIIGRPGYLPPSPGLLRAIILQDDMSSGSRQIAPGSESIPFSGQE